MNKQEKVAFVIETLNTIYPDIPIPLDHKDPYTLLIAVLLSAQSTDVRVNQITPLLFEIADNPYDMVKLTVEEIREIIKPVGLSPMKSKGIYYLSHILRLFGMAGNTRLQEDGIWKKTKLLRRLEEKRSLKNTTKKSPAS